MVWHGHRMPIQLVMNADGSLVHVHSRRKASTFGLPDSIEEELKAKAHHLQPPPTSTKLHLPSTFTSNFNLHHYSHHHPPHHHYL